MHSLCGSQADPKNPSFGTIPILLKHLSVHWESNQTDVLPNNAKWDSRLGATRVSLLQVKAWGKNTLQRRKTGCLSHLLKQKLLEPAAQRQVCPCVGFSSQDNRASHQETGTKWSSKWHLALPTASAGILWCSSLKLSAAISA